jgi:hypothetical protein
LDGRDSTYTTLSSSGSQKKSNINSLVYFSFPACTISNFKALVISTDVVLEVSKSLVKSTMLSNLTDVLSANFHVKLSQNGE